MFIIGLIGGLLLAVLFPGLVAWLRRNPWPVLLVCVAIAGGYLGMKFGAVLVALADSTGPVTPPELARIIRLCCCLGGILGGLYGLRYLITFILPLRHPHQDRRA